MLLTDRPRDWVHGVISLWDVPDLGSPHPIKRRMTKPNQIQAGLGFAIAKCFQGNRTYRPGGVYFEFENVGDPDDEITSPDYSNRDGREYYEDLQSSGARDFLRVPLSIDPALGVATGYEDIFGTDEGNKLTFFAQTSGTVGTHGKTFSDNVNSKIFGMALVAIPLFSDRTKDVVIARTYLAADDQAVKEVSKQLGLTWEISFTP